MAWLYGRQWTRDELTRRVGDMDQLAGVTLYEHADGPARGVRSLLVRTGSGFLFDVLLDRGMDIGMAEWRGQPLAWRSSTGNVAPAFYESSGLGWLRSFHGGLVATCGLQNVGSPTDENGEHFGIRGRINNTPAARVAYGADWEGDDYILWCQGQMRETRVFGENLRLTRRISTRLGANSLTIEDSVENLGYTTTPLMILYHINAGWPVLDESAELLISQASVEARDPDAEAGLPRLGRFEAPTPGFREQVYRHQVRPAADGTATLALVNRAFGGGQGFGLVIRYDGRALPSLWQWKMLGEGTYVAGLEPNLAHWHGRAAARASGSLRQLAPGETQRFRVEIGALTDMAAIDAVAREIEGVKRET
jgi:hypothetical protein